MTSINYLSSGSWLHWPYGKGGSWCFPGPHSRPGEWGIKLKTVVPLCLAPCSWEADWGEWVLCSRFSRLVLLGASMSLVPTPLLLCTVEPLDVAGCCGPAPRPSGPLISLSPKAAALLCLSPRWHFISPVVLCGLPCSPGTA